MNKKLILLTVILLSTALSACTNNQEITKQKTQNNLKSTVSTQNTAQNSSNSEANTSLKASNNSSQLNTNSSNNYSKYTGAWMPKNNVIKDSPFGIGVDIDVSTDGSVQGFIFESSTNFGHLAQARIKGNIENNILSCNFDNDGWGHNGKIELNFQGDTIVLSVKEVNSNGNADNTWGISKGTFTLLNMNSQIARTISDLRSGGWSDVQGQCFDVKLNSFGKVKFISEYNPYADYHFYLADTQGNIVYKLPDSNPSGVNTYDPNAPGAASGDIFDLSSISFHDINNDGLSDVIILLICKNPSSNSTKSKCNVYIQKNNKTFIIDDNLNSKLSKQNFTDMKSVLDYISK